MISKTLAQLAGSDSFLWVSTCVGLCIFFTFFAGLLVWIFKKERTELYQALGTLPLDAPNFWVKSTEVKNESK